MARQPIFMQDPWRSIEYTIQSSTLCISNTAEELGWVMGHNHLNQKNVYTKKLKTPSHPNQTLGKKMNMNIDWIANDLLMLIAND